jgi:hypothetical protein
LNGFSYGFKLEFNGDGKHQSCENLKSALHMREIVDLKIAKEIQLGRVIGPFNDLPLPRLKISPLCLVPKKKIWVMAPCTYLVLSQQKKKFQSMQAFQMKQQLFNILVLMMQ